MKKKGNPNLQIYGADILITHLTALVQEMEGVRQAKDLEAVHRMRVASRRLRATLPLFGQQLVGKKHLDWIKAVRGITRALGQARDADVQIDAVSHFLETIQSPNRIGVRRLVLRLRQQRASLQPMVLKELNKFEKSGVVSEMAQALAPFNIYHDRLDANDPGLIKLANRAIRAGMAEYLDFDEIVDQPAKVTELHAMRISAKRFRYTLETFAPLFEDGLKEYVKALRSGQDMLGVIHDCDVWGDLIPQFMEEERQRTAEFFGSLRSFKRLVPGLTLYQETRRSEREAVYNEFRETWKRWTNDGLWADLIAVLDARVATVTVKAADEEPALEEESTGETVASNDDAATSAPAETE
jgi:CHAD domain-containing protein